MKIIQIECLQIQAPQAAPDDLDGAVDTAVIRISADNGMYGLGETDAPPTAIAALLATPSSHLWSLSIRDLLLGENPLEVERLWEKVYEGTIYHGRRGLGIMLLSALDLALHDLRGKAFGLPVYQLLGGATRQSVVPYATLFPSMPRSRSWAEMETVCVGLLESALSTGFRAVKMETLFGDLISDRQWVDFILQCRRIAGDNRDLMVDVGYRWKSSKEALWALRRVEDAHLLFVETPLHTDDLDGLARLADATTTPVAVGEFLQTRHEFRELIERGHCDVIQPDLGRVGGLTEALRCARIASEKGLFCVPHAWKTGLTVAATRHFGAVVPNCPYVEFFDPAFFPSLLRSKLAGPDPELQSGAWTLPTTPGLGVTLNEEVLESCLVRPVTIVD